MASKERKRRDRTEKVLRPVHPNAAITAEYQRKLDRLIAEMNASVVYFLKASYRANEPRIMATDETPADALRRTMKELAKRWLKRFDVASVKLGEWFAQSVEKRSTAQLKKILKDGGIAIDFQLTPAMRDIMDATVNQNVSLIRSIPAQYLSEVEGMVQRSVQTGRDMGQLSSDLHARFGITKRRAALIARTQNEMATAAFNRARMVEAGITEAIWLHSHAGKTPRVTHVKAGRDKVRYEVAKGWYDPDPKVSRFIQPGELINCFPGWSVIASRGGCKKLWRHWYSGKLTTIVTSSGETFEATPNHPILTRRGWVAVQSLNLGEDVFKVADKIGLGVNPDVQGNEASISQLFDALALFAAPNVADGRGWFHGDVADGEIDVVDIDGFLPDEIDAFACKEFLEFLFADANHSVVGQTFDAASSLKAALSRLFGAPQCIVRGLGALLPLLKGGATGTDKAGLGLVSDMNARLHQAASDNPAIHAMLAGNLKLAHAGLVIGDDQVVRELLGIAGRASGLWNGDTPSAKVPGQIIGVAPYGDGGVLQEFAFAEKLGSVVNKGSVDFSGHVFNLETFAGHYTANTVITQNCRCVGKPVVKGFS